jgi:branched-chain amino acid aminotransferase
MKAIPFDKRDGYIWYDGKFVEWKDATIHILNHGLQYGSCVFEGERLYNGNLFKPEEHTKRLFHSAKVIDIEISYSADEINQAKEELVKKQNLKNAYMKVSAWKGCEKMTVESIGVTTHVAIAVWEMHSDYPSEGGIKLRTAEWRRPDPRSFPVGVKFAGAYVINSVAKHEAIKKGFDDAMMLDYRGYIAEGSASNIFFTKGKSLYTPAPGNFLSGITRETIIDIAKEQSIEVHEVEILPEDIAGFDGCFLTGTSVEVTKVVQVDGYKLKGSPMVDSLAESYYKLVGKIV